jgi:hypothetical protein
VIEFVGDDIVPIMNKSYADSSDSEPLKVYEEQLSSGDIKVETARSGPIALIHIPITSHYGEVHSRACHVTALDPTQRTVTAILKKHAVSVVEQTNALVGSRLATVQHEAEKDKLRFAGLILVVHPRLSSHVI